MAARRVSIENLESELARHGTRVRLDIDGLVPMHDDLSLSSLDDFHPDRLIERIAPLRELLDLAKRLGDPLAEEAAVREVAVLLGKPVSATASGAAPTAPPENRDHLLARLLGQPSGGQQPSSKLAVESLIRQAVGPASSRSPSKAATQCRAQVLELLAERLRRVLTLPDFRRVERAWRSVHWLVSRLEAEEVEALIVDLPKESLAAQLSAHSHNLETSPFHSLLSEQVDASVIVADYEFGLSAKDLVLLATIGAIASRSGTPFVAHGDLSLCGCSSPSDVDKPWEWAIADPDLAQLWSAVRRHPAAQWIALATPRFLLRQPFGKRTDPIESFAFEELPSRPNKDAFLWGNPAFACAEAIATSDGTWPVDAAIRVPDLPVAVYHDGSGEAVQAPVELVLTERVRTAIEHNGLIAFAGSMNADYIAASAIGPLARANGSAT